MKKLTTSTFLLVAALMLAFGPAATAQHNDKDAHGLPFMEDFEAMGDETPDDWIPEGWLNIDGNDNGHKWYWADFGDPEEEDYEAYMLSRSWDGDNPVDPDSWLITPAIELDEVGGEQEIELTFYVTPTASTAGFRTEKYQVLVSTTDDDPESFTMIYEETLSEDDENWVWLERVLDLTEYAGETVYVAFRHYDSPDNDRIALERVMIEVVGDDDVSVPDVADETAISVFPNPASSSLTISSKNQISEVIMTDITGRTVKALPANDVSVTLNISGISNGFYLVNIHTDKGVHTQKVQVIH